MLRQQFQWGPLKNMEKRKNWNHLLRVSSSDLEGKMAVVKTAKITGIKCYGLERAGIWKFLIDWNWEKLRDEIFNISAPCTCAVYSITSVTINTSTCIRSNRVLTRGAIMTPMTWRTFIYVCNKYKNTMHKWSKHAHSLLNQCVLL